jgi:hypothetical protein
VLIEKARFSFLLFLVMSEIPIACFTTARWIYIFLLPGNPLTVKFGRRNYGRCSWPLPPISSVAGSNRSPGIASDATGPWRRYRSWCSAMPLLHLAEVVLLTPFFWIWSYRNPGGDVILSFQLLARNLLPPPLRFLAPRASYRMARKSRTSAVVGQVMRAACGFYVLLDFSSLAPLATGPCPALLCSASKDLSWYEADYSV